MKNNNYLYDKNGKKLQASSVKNSFTKKYLIAISLIAILSTSAFMILKLALQESDSTALIVNVSGKQRMLSQRIASFSQQYYTIKYENNHHLQKEQIITHLQNAIIEMKKANQELSSGKFETKKELHLSKEIYDIYFGKTNLKQRVDDYLILATKILDLNDQKETKEALNSLLILSNGLLIDLNNAVLQYQKEGEDNISSIQSLEVIAWIMTILTLILEIFFIFKPMAQKIYDLFDEITKIDGHLESEIALRTKDLEEKTKELILANEKMQILLNTDPLTQVASRRFTFEQLEKYFLIAKRNETPLSLLLFDIDLFKNVNDRYGHDVGDEILKFFTKIIHQQLRKSDIFGRIGGEEFLICLQNTGIDGALALAEKLRYAVEKSEYLKENINIKITTSIGVSQMEMSDTNIDTALKKADIALYAAKEQGRNRVELYNQNDQILEA